MDKKLETKWKVALTALIIIAVTIPVGYYTFLNMNPNTYPNYKIIDLPGISTELPTPHIIVANMSDFEQCVILLQGSNAIVFRFTQQYGPGEYAKVYFFPYQGYLIMCVEE